jgi:hypothetical protein
MVMAVLRFHSKPLHRLAFGCFHKAGTDISKQADTKASSV